MPPTVHPPELIHLHGHDRRPFHRVKVTNPDDTPEDATNNAAARGFLQRHLIYSVKEVTSLWQANVRFAHNPAHVPEVVFYGETEAEVRAAAEKWMNDA